jgi:uncharacterized protein with ParB-like and HNH nuclease domain
MEKINSLNPQRKKNNKPKTEEEIEAAEQEIRKKSIPYEYQSKDFPIQVIKLRYDKTLIVPEYQRALVWDDKKQSKFIESLLLGVPIQPVFVATTEREGHLEIIDGSQRIRTINRFINGDLRLRGLEKLKSLNNFTFKDFDYSRQNKVENIDVRFHILTDKATPNVRADIFARINTTGQKLTDSQVRKGTFATNEFYKFILKMSSLSEFKTLYTGSKSNIDEGEPEELVLRYFVYADAYLEHKHDVRAFLDDYIQNRDNFSEEEKRQKEEQFKKMLSFVNDNFPYKFNKTSTGKAIPRVRFEAIAVGIHLALTVKPDLGKPAYMDWLDSDEFKNHTTTDASNNEGKLKERVEFVRDCLLGVKTKDMLNFNQ